VEDEVKFPEYVDVTDESKSFILGIMQKNPDDRMVMKDIFKHPFIRKYAAERKVSSDILEEFRRVLN
jgi:serine/threonine protein kinase